MIKHLTAVLFAAVSVIAVPTVAPAGALVALSCDGDVPEEWRRPGGFCDQEKGLNSLNPTGTGSPPTCIVLETRWEGLENFGDEVLVAGIVDPCCLLLGNLDGLELEEGTRVDVAVACCTVSFPIDLKSSEEGPIIVADVCP